MGKKHYNWKRFWIKREGQLNLSDGGYLSDPDSKYGIFQNPDALPFSSIGSSPCLILLGEPGIGKTHAIESEHNSLVTSDQNRKLILNLRSFSSEDRLHRVVSQILISIVETDHSLFLFLDSLDECLLRIDTVANLLIDILRGCPRDRLFLRIACRTAEWPSILEEGLIEIWGQDAVVAYELAPLRRLDVIAAAEANSIDPEKLQQEIDRVDAVPLAIKPVTLEFLLNTYARSGELPKTQIELYNRGCLILCEEQSLSRRSAKLLGNLSPEQRMAVASRIAAVIIFANKYAVWTGPDLGNVPEEDITIQELTGGTECAGGVFFEVTERAVRETLTTGLFSSRGAERMGWAHQTYAEFMASKYLIENRMALHQIMSLIIHPSDPGRRLVPQLHETAAWVASMDQEVFNRIMKTDPEVLLRSDIATGDDQTRRNLVASLLELIDREELLDIPRQNREGLSKLKHPGLGEQLKTFVKDESKNLFVRRTAIDIAEACELKELQFDLATIALNPEEETGIRVEAAHAIYRIGDGATRGKMLSLAEGEPGDSEDRLKGWGLYAVWPDHVNIEKLFSMITIPKRESYFGPYQSFLDYELTKHLQLSDIPIALNWVQNEEGRRLSLDPMERLKDEIMLKAWEYLDSPVIMLAFARTALARIREHDHIVRSDGDGVFQRKMDEDDYRRHILVEAIIHLLAEQKEDSSYILYSGTQFTLDRDLPWLIERLKAEKSRDIKLTWARSLKSLFRWGGNLEQVKMILNACQSIPILAEVFEDLLKPIILNSEEAKTLKKNYRMMTERKNKKRPIIPPPSERVVSLLEEFEAGNLDAWWALNREMTLEPDSVRYGYENKLSLQDLPGWKAADEKTKARILRAARSYIIKGKPQTTKWLGKPIVFRPAVSGVRALMLILERDPDFIDGLSPDTWEKWAPAILASSSYGYSNSENGLTILVMKAYNHGPDEIISTLTALIAKEDREHGDIFSLRKVDVCWDDRLANALFKKAQDTKLKAQSIGKILEALVDHHFQDSYDYTRSLLNQYTPEGKRSELAFLAAGALLKDTRINWKIVWPVLQGDEEFGRKVLESLSYGGRRDGGLFSQLAERELAEFFVWLSCQYPHQEDPKFDGAHSVGSRESIGHWRDDILRDLKNRGTPEACDSIEWIMNELPHLEWLKWTLLDARAITRQKTWIPPEPKDVLTITKDSQLRLVIDGAQLLEAIIESLNRLQGKLHGETPSVVFLWDEVAKGKFKPKDEGRLSDFVKIHLDEDLVKRGIIVNREVEVRRIKGSGTGERTDIHVDALKKKADAEVYDRITVVIETKGCWNTELNTAMETQLDGQYLDEARCRHGLYLVGWYNCEVWTDDDYRKRQAPKISLDKAREQLQKQATELSKEGKGIKSFIVDTGMK